MLRKNQMVLNSPIKIEERAQQDSHILATSNEMSTNGLKSSSTPNKVEVKRETGVDITTPRDDVQDNYKNELVEGKSLESMNEIQGPEIEGGKENENGEDSSKSSSPFNSRVDTAGTNLTFLTKANPEFEQPQSNVNGNSANELYKKLLFFNCSDEELKNLTKPDLEEFGDSGTERTASVVSSPCIERTRKKTTEREKGEKLKRRKLEIFNHDDKEHDYHSSFDSVAANNGSAGFYDQDEKEDSFEIPEPKIPLKYYIDGKPIYEHMEGEEAFYYDIIGKKNKEEKVDDNEKQFLEFVHLNFDQWREQNEAMVKEYDRLMKKVIVARLKFDRRVQFLKKNIDSFALHLEKYGEEIGKRSDILKEYCSKIVSEME